MAHDLQTWMRDNQVNDEALAKRVGVSRVQILRIRNRTNRPSRKTALKLQEITGIPAAALLFGAEVAA